MTELPPKVADQVIVCTTGLRDLGSGGSVDWSDTWTEEDVTEVRNASLSGFDNRKHGIA